jgi:hypothetical protein
MDEEYRSQPVETRICDTMYGGAALASRVLLQSTEQRCLLKSLSRTRSHLHGQQIWWGKTAANTMFRLGCLLLACAVVECMVEAQWQFLGAGVIRSYISVVVVNVADGPMYVVHRIEQHASVAGVFCCTGHGMETPAKHVCTSHD